MTVSRWRIYSRGVIERVAREVGTDDPEKLKRAISAAYPFGERAHYPYKMWLREVNDFMAGLSRFKAKKPEQPGMFEDLEKVA